MKSKPLTAAQVEQETRKLALKVQFYFTPIEADMLDKIASTLFTTKAERRLAFLLLGRWCLSNWDKLAPAFVAELRYAASEGVPCFDLSQRKIAMQSKMVGKARRV